MLSRISYSICAGILLYLCFIFYPKWNNTRGEAPIGWDVATYYWYLPSSIIYKDLKHQKFADSILTKYNPFEGGSPFLKPDNGSDVLIYTAGMAFMYLPLFIVAHIAAPSLGYPADGFSVPYQFAMQFGSLLFALLGLWYYRKLLRLYFEDKIVAILILALVLGTAYLNYSGIDGPMTHCWLFGIYALLLLNTHHFYNTPAYKYAIRIGILSGLAILIRPSEIICVLLPLLWGMESLSKEAIKKKLAFLKQHIRYLTTAAICIILIGSIQLIYWKYVSGHWFVYSYGDDKTFSWLSPHVYNYILSFKSGWLVYAPIMFISVIGFWYLVKNGKNKVAIIVFSVLNLYIISAWDIWWYAGIPARAMIQGYAVLLFPFGYALQSMMQKRVAMFLVYLFMILAAYVNVWTIINAHKANGLFDSDNMNEAYYKHVVGRWHVSEDVMKLKDTDELFEGTPQNMKFIYQNDFENNNTLQPKYPAIQGKISDYIENGREQSTLLDFSFEKGKAEWIRVQATYHSQGKEWNNWKMPKLVVSFMTKDSVLVKDNSFCPHRFLNDNDTRELYLDVRIPDKSFDKVEVLLFNRGSDKTLLYDNVKVWSFNE